MRKRYILAMLLPLLSFRLLLPHVIAFAEDKSGRQEQSSSIRGIVDQLHARDVDQRHRAVRGFRDLRRDAIAALLEVVKDGDDAPNFNYAQTAAVKLLGEYRAAEACDLLTSKVARFAAVPISRGHPLDAYPAAQSLVQIGMPSIDVIFARFSKPVSDRETTLFAYVLFFIYEQDRALGLLRLRREIGDSSDHPDGQTARLQRLLEAFDEI